MTRIEVPNSGARRGISGRLGRWLTVLVLLVVLGGVLWTLLTLSWAYAEGERAGVLQKFVRRGWLCKTQEGEIALYYGGGQYLGPAPRRSYGTSAYATRRWRQNSQGGGSSGATALHRAPGDPDVLLCRDALLRRPRDHHRQCAGPAAGHRPGQPSGPPPEPETTYLPDRRCPCRRRRWRPRLRKTAASSWRPAR